MSTSRFTIAPHILWPSIVVAFLLMSVLACGLTVYFAVSDPSFAVEKDYYEKALNWDDRAAQLQANESLGWTATARMGETLSPLGDRTLTVTLTDASGRSVDEATVVAEVFHPARSSDRLDAAFTYQEGHYVTTGRFTRKGVWRVKGTARVGETVFTFETAAPQVDNSARQSNQGEGA
jgi:nitrogen fixation protein FixH